MRKFLVVFAGLLLLACNNSAKKKEPVRDTVKTGEQKPGTAAVPDTIFTGTGTEPFWALYIIAEKKIVFHPSEGADIEVPFVPGATIGDTTTYLSGEGDHSIKVDILKKNCSDGMSELVYPYEVLLLVNKIKYAGCGRLGK